MSLPIYNHSFTSELINYDDGLPKEKIDEGLALPRQTFIEDLEKLITDMQTRREYYYEEVSDNYYLLNYALNFLSIFEAKESLPKLLEVVEESNEFTNYWFSEFLEPSYIAFLYYPFFKDDFDSLLEIITKKKNYIVYSGLINIPAQVALKELNRREEAIDFYKNLMEFISKLEEGHSLFDEFEVNVVFNSVLLIEGKELQEQVLQLYDKELTDNIFISKDKFIKEFEYPNYSIQSDQKLKLDFTPYQVFEKSLGVRFTYELTQEETEKNNEEIRKRMEENRIEINDENDEYNEYNLSLNHYDPKTDKSLYGRNDKVSVKYEDGKVLENVKYKKIEKDVKEGKCQVIK